MTSDEEDDAEAHRAASEWGIPLRDQQGTFGDLLRGLGDRPMHWIEDEHGDVVPVSVLVWAEYMENARRIVQQDEPGKRWFRSHYLISTVFLGIDHSFVLHGPPILYETMIFQHGAVRALLERLKLYRVIRLWERLRRKVLFKWDITLPSIMDSSCAWQWRYRTRAEALDGHLRIVEMVRKGVPSRQWGEVD